MIFFYVESSHVFIKKKKRAVSSKLNEDNHFMYLKRRYVPHILGIYSVYKSSVWDRLCALRLIQIVQTSRNLHGDQRWTRRPISTHDENIGRGNSLSGHITLCLPAAQTPCPLVQLCQSSKWHVVTIRFRRPCDLVWRRLNGGGSTYICEG